MTSKYPELIKHLTEQHDLILLDSEIQEIEYMISLNEKTSTTFRSLGDFDVWYMPCKKCGYDTAKSVKPKEGVKNCWKCGGRIYRDYSDRALKIS